MKCPKYLWGRPPRRHPWHFRSSALLFAGAFSAGHASAEDRWAVRIACAELSHEELARVEVRLLVELGELKAAPGEIALECTEDSVRGEWLESGVVKERRSVSRTDHDDATEVLLWLGSMLVEVRKDRPVVEVGVAAAALSVEGEPSGKQSDEPSEVAVPASAPVQESARKIESPPGIAADTLADEVNPGGAAPRIAHEERHLASKVESTWGVDAGLAYEHWGSTLAGAVGARAGGEWLHPSGFGAAISLGAHFSVGFAQGFSVSDYVLAGTAVFAPWPRVRLGLGPVVSLAHIASPGTLERSAVSRDVLTAGGELTIRSIWPNTRFGGWVQIGVRGLAEQRDVVLDVQETVVVIPSWQALAALGVRFRL